MATERRLIDAEALKRAFRTDKGAYALRHCISNLFSLDEIVDEAPTVDAVEVVHGKRLYNAHEVAEIIADLFGDSCACNFNGIDEWLPFKCELQDACPNPAGVACWEQYLKHMEET